MNSECCICFNNIAAENSELWMCKTCNIEVHRHCKDTWDTTQVGNNNTCPHCRCEDETEITIFPRHTNPIIVGNVGPGELINNSYFHCSIGNIWLYGKLLAIIILGIFCAFIITGLLLIIISEFQYVMPYNYTTLR